MYNGYAGEQIQTLSIETLMPLLNSRQRRSLDRRISTYMTDEQRKFREELKLSREGKLSSPLKTHLRDMIILPDMIGLSVLVHNGKEFIPFTIRPEMVGHYLGEYSITNKRVQHGSPGVGSSRSSLYVPLK
ncbi:MAG TPA: 30S ribosomal protein S19 [Candidatus Nitrosocosmicus sp.]|nr:30S ribosomal protein S19 [Candidatus Nitrosocosmicus sp.]